MKVEITVPEEYVGDVIGDINARRGRMEGMEAVSGNQVVRGFIPLSVEEMFGYATDLRSKTQGKYIFNGTFTLWWSSKINLEEISTQRAKKND